MTEVNRDSALARKPQCAVCNSEDRISRCADCMVICYCCRDHQVSHWKSHKANCHAIKKSRARVVPLEDRLRKDHPDMFPPANVFESKPRYIWHMSDGMSAYVNARYEVMCNLLHVKTRDAVKAALREAEDLLRMWSSDVIGIRSWLPGMYLRLGYNQKCYDFVRSHGVVRIYGNYHWGDVSLPFVDVMNSDVYKPVDAFIEHTDTGGVIALTLLKIKLLTDLHAMRTFAAMFQGKLPAEILDCICSNVVPPVVSQGRELAQNLLHDDNIDVYIKRLDLQIKKLFGIASKRNRHFWPALTTYTAALFRNPYVQESVREMRNLMQQHYDAWAESNGAIEAAAAIIGTTQMYTFYDPWPHELDPQATALVLQAKAFVEASFRPNPRRIQRARPTFHRSAKR